MLLVWHITVTYVHKRNSTKHVEELMRAACVNKSSEVHITLDWNLWKYPGYSSKRALFHRTFLRCWHIQHGFREGEKKLQIRNCMLWIRTTLRLFIYAIHIKHVAQTTYRTPHTVTHIQIIIWNNQSSNIWPGNSDGEVLGAIFCRNQVWRSHPL